MRVVRAGEGAESRLQLSGELDLATADTVAEQIGRVLAEPGLRRLAVDLAGLTFCDSTGVDALLVAQETAARRGVELRVRRPRGIVRRAIVAIGVYEQLTGAEAPAVRPRGA